MATYIRNYIRNCFKVRMGPSRNCLAENDLGLCHERFAGASGTTRASISMMKHHGGAVGHCICLGNTRLETVPLCGMMAASSRLFGAGAKVRPSKGLPVISLAISIRLDDAACDMETPHATGIANGGLPTSHNLFFFVSPKYSGLRASQSQNPKARPDEPPKCGKYCCR
jgi:hypothetical protein